MYLLIAILVLIALGVLYDLWVAHRQRTPGRYLSTFRRITFQTRLPPQNPLEAYMLGEEFMSDHTLQRPEKDRRRGR